MTPNENKQTAVEWLIDFIETNIISLEMEIDTPEKHDHWDNAKAKAKQMEKEQQKTMFDCGRQYQLTGEGTFTQVYNELYNK